MTSPERIYHGSIRALAVAFIAVGALLLALTLIAGGGPLSLGFILGLAFMGVGAGRLWIAGRLAR